MNLKPQKRSRSIYLAGFDFKNFLVFLYKKGESIEELLGAVTFLRKQGVVLQSRHADLIDCCGTGGDQKNTFNISIFFALL